MTTLRPKVYEYEVDLKWAESKKGVLSSAGKPNIEAATPPEFNGHPGYWTPEHLFVASIEACLMSTVLSIIDKQRLNIISYHSQATGYLQTVDDVFRFAEVLIQPQIVISHNTDSAKRSNALMLAEERCLIGNSLITKVTVKSTVELQT
jgi:organic hydroperoxide reductase OsmC/OhrA